MPSLRAELFCEAISSRAWWGLLRWGKHPPRNDDVGASLDSCRCEQCSSAKQSPPVRGGDCFVGESTLLATTMLGLPSLPSLRAAVFCEAISSRAWWGLLRRGKHPPRNDDVGAYLIAVVASSALLRSNLLPCVVGIASSGKAPSSQRRCWGLPDRRRCEQRSPAKQSPPVRGGDCFVGESTLLATTMLGPTRITVVASSVLLRSNLLLCVVGIASSGKAPSSQRRCLGHPHPDASTCISPQFLPQRASVESGMSSL